MRLFNRSRPEKRQPAVRPEAASGSPSPIRPHVFMLIHNPVIRSQGGRKLSDLLAWNDPDWLAQQYIKDVQEASYGYANYEIVERMEVDGCPVKADGFAYTAEDYYQRWYTRTGWHQPDLVDYGRLMSQFQMIGRINDGRIDEVWLFGFPYAGYYESIMAGPGAFWCNAPPIENRQARRRFVIMGFNFERGVGEMLENLGHRTESIMRHVYRHKRGQANLWERFTRYDKTHPGQAECGNVHFAPNSQRDYDWGNTRQVPGRCDNWLTFPDLSGEPKLVNCREWGNGDIRQHHLWWLRHLPCVTGSADGISHNWWEYVVDPNKVSKQ
jgi:hypothetical protein